MSYVSSLTLHIIIVNKVIYDGSCIAITHENLIGVITVSSECYYCNVFACNILIDI